MSLPPDTKYKVASAIADLVTQSLVPMLQAQGLEMERLDVVVIDRLNMDIRIRPRDNSGPRHIYVKVSEPW